MVSRTYQDATLICAYSMDPQPLAASFPKLCSSPNLLSTTVFHFSSLFSTLYSHHMQSLEVFQQKHYWQNRNTQIYKYPEFQFQRHSSPAHMHNIGLLGFSLMCTHLIVCGSAAALLSRQSFLSDTSTNPCP